MIGPVTAEPVLTDAQAAAVLARLRVQLELDAIPVADLDAIIPAEFRQPVGDA